MNMHALDMQLAVVVGGGLDFAYRLAGAAQSKAVDNDYRHTGVDFEP